MHPQMLMMSMIRTRNRITDREMRMERRNLRMHNPRMRNPRMHNPHMRPNLTKCKTRTPAQIRQLMRKRLEMERIAPSAVIVGEYDAEKSAVDSEKQRANKIFSSRFFDVIANMNSNAEPHVVLLDTEFLVSTREILKCCPNAYITIVEINAQRVNKITHAIAGMLRVNVIHAEITEYLREHSNSKYIDVLFLDLMCTQIPNMQSVLDAVKTNNVQLLAVTICLRDRSGIPYPQKWNFMRKQIETIGLYADTNWVYHSHTMMMALSIHTKIATSCYYRRDANGRYPGWGTNVPV